MFVFRGLYGHSHQALGQCSCLNQKVTRRRCRLQVEVHNVEAYHYDGECLAKADDMGKPGVLVIKQLQVCLEL